MESACDFDNPGLLLGDSGAPVTGITVALDCTRAVIESAIQHGCNLIVTHHPVIFHKLAAVTAGTIPYEVIQNNLSVISMHTNLDIGDGGVNDCLCRAIGLHDVKKVTAHDGFCLRIGMLSPCSADGLALHLRQSLGASVTYTAVDRPIQAVMVCSGSGDDYLSEAIGQGCDALITAEVRHHQFLAAAHANIALFDAGHFHTEDVVTEPLRELLQSRFPALSFHAEHTNIIKTV